MTPQPATPPKLRELPRPLTFFLTGRERAAVLRALHPIHTDRSAALLAALGVPRDPTTNEKTGERAHVQQAQPIQQVRRTAQSQCPPQVQTPDSRAKT